MSTSDPGSWSMSSNGDNSSLHYVSPEGPLHFKGPRKSCELQLEEWQAKYENKPRTREREEMKGIKYDDGKARMSLVPHGAMEEVAKVLAFGANKYSPGNWAKGIQYSRLLDAAERHVGAFNEGQDKDNESGLSHIAHATCCLLFLLWMEKNKPEMDDRWIKEIK